MLIKLNSEKHFIKGKNVKLSNSIAKVKKKKSLKLKLK